MLLSPSWLLSFSPQYFIAPVLVNARVIATGADRGHTGTQPDHCNRYRTVGGAVIAELTAIFAAPAPDTARSGERAAVIGAGIDGGDTAVETSHRS